MTSEAQSDWLVELSHMTFHVGLFCWTNYPIAFFYWEQSRKAEGVIPAIYRKKGVLPLRKSLNPMSILNSFWFIQLKVEIFFFENFQTGVHNLGVKGKTTLLFNFFQCQRCSP
jgi:hypothetical protein